MVPFGTLFKAGELYHKAVKVTGVLKVKAKIS